MKRDFPAYQAEAMTQLHTGRITRGIIHTKTLRNQNNGELSSAQNTAKQSEILKVDSNNTVSVKILQHA